MAYLHPSVGASPKFLYHCTITKYSPCRYNNKLSVTSQIPTLPLPNGLRSGWELFQKPIFPFWYSNNIILRGTWHCMLNIVSYCSAIHSWFNTVNCHTLLIQHSELSPKCKLELEMTYSNSILGNKILQKFNQNAQISHKKMHWHETNLTSLTLSQCTLAGPVYTGMLLECHWLTQCTLGYHWKNLVETVPHWNATGET